MELPDNKPLGHSKPMDERAARIMALLRIRGRGEAEQTLYALGPEAIVVAQELLEPTLAVQRRGCSPIRWLLPMLLTPILLYPLHGSVHLGENGDGPLVYPPNNTLLDWVVLYCVVALMPGIFVSIGWNLFLSFIEKAIRPKSQWAFQEIAVRLLANSDDMCAVGPLLEVARWGTMVWNQQIEDEAHYGLMRLLPRLQMTDAQALTAKQRDCLYNLLLVHSSFVLPGAPAPSYVPNTKFDVPLSEAILKAYEHIGDTKALALVQKLAASEGKLAEAAQECLPRLQEQTEKWSTGEHLLRATDEPISSPDILLRPASATTEIEPQQLLRASTTEENSKP
jgi:hypothetical protein